MASGPAVRSRARGSLNRARRSGTSLERALRDAGTTLPRIPIPPADRTSRTDVHRHRASPRAPPARSRLGAHLATPGRLRGHLRPDPGAVAPDRGARAATHRRPDGVRRPLRRILLLRPDGMGHRRHHPRHQPQRLRLRQTRPRQERPGEGLPAPDDPLRLPHPGPRRRQGRVRRHRPRPRRRPLPHRPRPPRTHQPPRPRTPRRRLGRPRPRRDTPPQRRPPDPLARPHPRPRRLPTRPVHPHREPHHLPSAARPHRLGPRPDPAHRRDPAPAVGHPRPAHRPARRRLPLPLAPRLLRRHPRAPRRPRRPLRRRARRTLRRPHHLPPRLARPHPVPLPRAPSTAKATKPPSASP